MQQTFTSEFMHANCGCYSPGQLNARSFMQQPEITLSAIINSEILLKDKYWFVCEKLATKEQNQQIAIRCAEIVLPIYEAKHPGNKVPREATEAAKLFITGHISIEELLAKQRAAAYAADAAAYAADAYAADAAAYAADAAAYAADAADYAADAAAAAADAAAAAADAAAAAAAAYAAAAAAADALIKQQLHDYLIEICS